MSSSQFKLLAGISGGSVTASWWRGQLGYGWGGGGVGGPGSVLHEVQLTLNTTHLIGVH